MKTKALVLVACLLPSSAFALSNSVQNCSGRANVNPTSHVATLGFITDNAISDFVFTALGPSLKDLGVLSTIADPYLTVSNSSGVALGSNNNYLKNDPMLHGIYPKYGVEAALGLSTAKIKPGSAYTIQGKSNTNLSGVVGMNVYATGSPPPDNGSGLVNCSLNGYLKTNNPVIVGMIVTSDLAKCDAQDPDYGCEGHAYIFRAKTLAGKDVKLTVYDQYGQVIGTNGTWGKLPASQLQVLSQYNMEADLAATDAAYVVGDLPNGAYTAVAETENGATDGEAIVEFYQLSVTISGL